MSFKYLELFLFFLIIKFSPNILASEQRPIFHFEQGDRLISIIGSVHCAQLDGFLPEAEEMAQEYSSFIIEHEIGNMVLDFLEEIPRDELEKSMKPGLDSDMVKNLDRFLESLQKISPTLIRSFDIVSGEKKEVSFEYKSLLNLKPWLAELLLCNQALLRLMGETGGTELAMARLFAKQGKEIDYLETSREVFDILDKNQKFNKEEFLRAVIILLDANDFNFFRKNMNSITFPQRHTFINNKNVHPESVKKRNRLWLPKIKAIAQSLEPKHKKTLIIVGYGHLLGLDGLIARILGGDTLKGWKYRV